MKILFFSHQAEFIYGGEIVTMAFMRELKLLGHNCYLASPSGPYQAAARKDVTTFTVPSVQFKRTIGSFVNFLPAFFKTRRKLKELICDHKIEILHATSLKAMVYAIFLPKDIKVVWHHHDILPNRWSNRVWIRVLANSAHKILVPSQSAKEGLQLAGIEPKKITVLYNGFPLQDWPSRSSVDLAKEIRLGFIGEISHRKGADWLPLVFGTLVKNYSHTVYSLKIAGEALSEKNLLERIKNQLKSFDQQISFLGYIRDSKKFYEEIDLLLVPSRQDPYPTVIIEAGLKGVPVIACGNGGIPEMIENGHNGFLVQSEQEMVEKIVALSIPAHWKEFSTNATNTARRKYDIQARVKELVNIYQSMF